MLLILGILGLHMGERNYFESFENQAGFWSKPPKESVIIILTKFAQTCILVQNMDKEFIQKKFENQPPFSP